MSVALKPNALTTVARIQAEGITASSDSITRRINALSQRLESFCGRKFGYRAFSADSPELYQGSGGTDLYLKSCPIRTVSLVRVNGSTYTVSTVSGTTPLPLSGQTVWRTADWDQDGRLYLPSGWSRWTGRYGDLTGDPNSNHVRYNVQVAYTGGYILPQYSGVTEATYNPSGAASDLDEALEAAVVAEICVRFEQPANSRIVSEGTPGGYRVSFQRSQGSGGGPREEFAPENLEVFYSFRTAEAILI